MKLRSLIVAGVCVIAGCSTQMPPDASTKKVEQAKKPVPTKEVPQAESRSLALTLEGYKRVLARRICEANSPKVYTDRPQALLRSVIVIKYQVSADGKLLHAEFLRSNRDKATEATAMNSLYTSAPFPKPLPHLLRDGKLEISETWLFNDDGRFQLRTTALPQVGDE